MHGYKKKLLDRYPEKKELPPSAAPVEDTAVKAAKPKTKTPQPAPELSEPLKAPVNVEELKQAFQVEQKKDETLFRRELAASRRQIFARAGVSAAAAFLAALLGIGIGVRWTDAHFRPNWENELGELQKQASLKLDRFLSSREVQALLEDKAKAQGEKTAEKEMKELVASAVSPAAARMDEGAKRLQVQGDAVLMKLKGLSDFMLLELKAKNDDRKAFEELLAVSRDRSHEYRELASQAVSQVFILVTSLNVQDPSLADKSAEAPQASYVSFDQFKASYRDAVSLNRPKLLSEMFNSRQFSEAQKTAFLVEVIRNDTSLRAMAWACRLLDEKAKIYKPFTAYEKYLEWAAQNSIRS